MEPLNAINEISKNSDLQDSLYPKRKVSFLPLWRTIFKNIRDYSFFIHQLSRLAIIGDFKRSNIGITWLFIAPIFSVIMWVFFNSAGILDPGDTGIPYPAYVLLSSSIWGFFVGMYQKASNILISRRNMIITTHFPHEVLVVERALVHLIRFIIPFLINIIVLLLFGVRFNLIALIFPFTLLPLMILGIAIGLIVSLLRVVAVDIAKIFDSGIGFLMFLTPVIYAPKIDISWLSPIIKFNPLTYLIGFSRNVLTQGNFYEPVPWAICTLLSLIFLLIVVRIFFIAESKVVERFISI